MPHTPYHNEPIYDVGSNAPTYQDTMSPLGYDFTGSKYEKYFDKYDATGENFATQSNALNQAYQNQQYQSGVSGFQDQLANQRRNTPNTGFAGSGSIERGLNQSRDQIMRGYNDLTSSFQYNQAQSNLGLQKDIWGMRKDYKEDTRGTLIDLIGSGADLDAYETDFQEEQETTNRLRGNMNKDPYENGNNYNTNLTVNRTIGG